MPELPKITINHLEICVRNINGLNPDDIVDLRSCIEKSDLAIFCETWLKEFEPLIIRLNGETTCKCC